MLKIFASMIRKNIGLKFAFCDVLSGLVVW